MCAKQSKNKALLPLPRLVGKTVAVPPDLTTDPVNKQGEVGRIIFDDGNDLTAEFNDGTRGRYMDSALIVLDSYQNILRNLKQPYIDLQEFQVRALLQILKLQSQGKEATALSVAVGFPSLLPYCTLSCNEAREMLIAVQSENNKKSSKLRP